MNLFLGAFGMLAGAFCVGVAIYAADIADKELEVANEERIAHCVWTLREVRGESPWMGALDEVCIEILNGREVM